MIQDGIGWRSFFSVISTRMDLINILINCEPAVA